jgi:hypothetical protein
MKSYKVEITETVTYVFDVQAQDEQEASDQATILMAEANNNGTYHYHQTGDTIQEVSTVYDVTGTDDDAFINNN